MSGGEHCNNFSPTFGPVSRRQPLGFENALYRVTSRGEGVHGATMREIGQIAPAFHRPQGVWQDERAWWYTEISEGRAIKFNVTIDRDEDGIWIVECPSIPGCVTQGATKDEALANIEEAIRLCLEVRADQGLPLTIETRLIEVAA